MDISPHANPIEGEYLSSLAKPFSCCPAWNFFGLATCLLLGLVFVLAMLVPFGSALWALYLIPLWTAWYWQGRRTVILATGLVCFFVTFDLLWSAGGENNLERIINKAGSLAVLVLAGLFLGQQVKWKKPHEGGRQNHCQPPVSQERHTEDGQRLGQEVQRLQQTDQAWRESDERLQLALQAAGIGTWSCNFVTNTCIWDDFLHALFGLKPGTFPGRQEDFLQLVHPDDRKRVQQEVERTVVESSPYETEFRVVWPDGSLHVLCARGKVNRDADGRPGGMSGVCWDDTKRRKMEEALAKSNAELKQFAYVASHDLQEPLRMVSSYLELLEQRYLGQLDDKALRWIHFAVEGAARMQRLINDLLLYSRITNLSQTLKPIDTQAVLAVVQVNLHHRIQESGALIHLGHLPTVFGDTTQLTQLFQNLISNALKYRSAQPPQLHITAVPDPAGWLFSVRDNGIGLDMRFAERIFVIFQRLHTQEKYPGTGIGLAVCKKIVEHYGGRIWVQSEPAKGATFFFTLPACGGMRYDSAPDSLPFGSLSGKQQLQGQSSATRDAGAGQQEIPSSGPAAGGG